MATSIEPRAVTPIAPSDPAPITAFIVAVPEAEPLVADLRARFDPSAAEGVPAHVTVLVPFMAPDALTPAVLARARTLCAAEPAFDFRLTAVRRWPTTCWLAPEPSAPFVALTRAMVDAFPGYPPYAGQHADIVPHLTVADGDAAAADAAEAALRARWPADAPGRCRCTEVLLIGRHGARWRTLHRLPLGPSTGL